MKFPKRKQEVTRLDPQIEDLIDQLNSHAGFDDDYKSTMARLNELYELRDKELKKRVSPDTLAIVGGNVAIASLVLWFERSSVVTTKLATFLTKLR